MARGHIRKRSDVSWTIYYDEPPDPVTGKRKRRGKAVRGTKKDAERELAKILATIDEGTYVTPTSMTLADFLKRWVRDYAKPNLSPATLSSYEMHIRNHIIPALGSLQISRLTPTQIQDFYHEKLQNGRKDGTGGLSHRTVNYFHQILHLSLGHAVRWQLIPRNPTEAVEPPKPRKSQMKYWTREEAQKFLNHISDHRLYALYRLAITTGLRQGELLGLRWQDVDFEARQLYIRHVLARTPAGEIHFKEPKTDRSQRSVSLTKSDVDCLKHRRSIQVEERLKVASAYQDNDLVFATQIGTAFHPRNLLRQFKTLAEDAGVPEIRFHDLRHTYASLALSMGVQAKIVQERLGHSRITTTLDTYSHLLPNMQAEAAELFEREFNKNSSSTER